MPILTRMQRRRRCQPTKLEAKSTVEIMLAKYCSKELRIVLSRCDKLVEEYRRATAAGPPVPELPDLEILGEAPPTAPKGPSKSKNGIDVSVNGADVRVNGSTVDILCSKKFSDPCYAGIPEEEERNEVPDEADSCEVITVKLSKEVAVLQQSGVAGAGNEEDSSEDNKSSACTAFVPATVFNRASPASGRAAMWFACVMWDTKVFDDLLAHELSGHQLLTTLLMGKLLVESLRKEEHSWPGLSKMDWKKPFDALDIITDDIRQCGDLFYLRVQEKCTVEVISDNRSPDQYDLIIDPSCKPLADEMIRLHSYGVKTSVILWGAEKHLYPIPRITPIKGEIRLRPNDSATGSDVLSALIFHSEDLSCCYLGRMIHGPMREIELWNDFNELGLEFIMKINTDNETQTHLTFHVRKDYPETSDDNGLELI